MVHLFSISREICEKSSPDLPGIVNFAFTGNGGSKFLICFNSYRIVWQSTNDFIKKIFASSAMIPFSSMIPSTIVSIPSSIISSKFDLVCSSINQNTFQNWHCCLEGTAFSEMFTLLSKLIFWQMIFIMYNFLSWVMCFIDKYIKIQFVVSDVNMWNSIEGWFFKEFGYG